MIAFLLTFFLIYGTVHFYVFVKARAAFGFGLRAGIPLLAFMIVMVAAPVLVRITERAGYETFARFLAYVGYVWMGVLFLFFSASILLDGYRFVVVAAGFVVRKDFSSFLLPHRAAFFVSLILSLLISVYGYFEARDIRLTQLRIVTPKISREAGTIRVVQISDVHLGLLLRERRLQRILDVVRKARPDLVVSTGDLVDGQMDDLAGLADLLAQIHPRFGKYGVTGNHEFYAGLDYSLKFLKRGGFTLLRGKGVSIGGGLQIAGVDDPTGKAFGRDGMISEKKLLSGLDRDHFILFLKHRPVVSEEAKGLFDLQLSGHVHKGQIFPFNFVTRFFYPVPVGRLQLKAGSSFYVSPGSGTWGPPLRFLAPPEVTLIELVPG
jgi:predicted MPP superfamily phosphohydrolase